MTNDLNFTEPNEAQADDVEGSKQPSKGRAWLGAVIALVAGLAIGAGVTYGVTASQLSAKDSEINEVRGQLEVVQASEAQLKSERDDVAAREEQLVKDTAAAEAEAKARTAELEAAAADLDVREAAISAAEAAYEAATFGPGMQLVGQDIVAGTYRSTGGSFCYWERLRGTGGGFDEMISNGSTEGSAVVTIDESDVAFNSNGCGDWEPQG